jgi:hypothetical protein
MGIKGFEGRMNMDSHINKCTLCAVKEQGFWSDDVINRKKRMEAEIEVDMCCVK